MLAGTELKKAFDSGVWRAYRDGKRIGAGDLKIGPHSADISLQPTLLTVRRAMGFDAIDPHDPDSQIVDAFQIPERGFVLRPGDFVLGATRERFECDAALQTKIPSVRHGERDLTDWTYFHQVYEGRSTCARLGLSSHQCAGYCDWHFDGTITLELSALVPVRLYAGMRIGQVSWSEISGVPTAYDGAYQIQEGPRAAELGPERF